LGASLLLSKPAFSDIFLPRESAEARLLLYNIHTEERLDITYREPSGEYDPQALATLNWFLRCHYTNRTVNMDVHVIEFLNTVTKMTAPNKEIHIISGYRSPEYNELLRREGRHVAKHSMHLKGKAIDFCIPRYDLAVLRRTAVGLRYGGVGYYPGDFVHIDSGRFRTW
jgi:uncharacterized protein YcbK (DUF882 family)